MKHLIVIDHFRIGTFLLISFFSFLFIQELSGQKDPLKQGNLAFDQDHFREALVYFNQIEKIEKSAPILFKRGVCYYEINQLDHAIGDFQTAWEFGFKDPKIDYYMGLIQHHRGNFDQAAKYYKKYLKELDQEDITRISVRKLIKQCGKAIDLSYKRPLAIIEKLPGGINTVYDEIGLIQSPTQEGKYYFTSNKPNTATSMSASDYDVYWTTNTLGEWSDAQRMKYTINKRDHDILLGFTPYADGLYFYRGKEYQGGIFLNSGTGDNSRTTDLKFPVPVVLFNSNIYFYDDHVALFSSKELQGYGGYDLYVSISTNGEWSTPQNLGPQINGPFDEMSPYLSYDGSQLYFSSNRDESIGGFDIFFSSYLYEAHRWGTPVNMGIPINAPGDETHFSLSYDGLTAMLSSDRKNAFGGKDLYIARFKEKRGLQGFDSDVLAFINYKIPERDYEKNSSMLEGELAETTAILSNELADNQNKENIGSPETTEIKFQPIYYSSGIDLINENNLKQIDKLIRIMHLLPALEIEFNCHTHDEGILEYKLFSSLKIAERLELYFIKKGIDKHRIHVIGFADNYPIAKSEKAGGDERYSSEYNSRIEFGFSNYDKDKVKIERISPDIPGFTQDRKFDLYNAMVGEAITYKIQIAVVSQMYRGMALDLFNDAIVEEDEDTGLYAYTIGLYDNYAEALNVKRDMDRLGITDAKVIAYYNGRRLSEDQYVYYVNNYPDLKNLMNYNE